MKLLRKIVFGLIILVVAVVLLKNPIIKFGAEKGVAVVTGLQLKIKSLNLSILKTKMNIKGLVLYNPKGFQERTMIDIPEINIAFERGSLLKGKPHFEDLTFNMEKFVVVKGADGTLNLDALKMAGDEEKEKSPEAKREGGAPAIPPLRIDNFNLRLGKVIYVDETGAESKTREFNVNLDKTFHDIIDPRVLTSLIVMEIFKSTTLGKLTNFDIKGLDVNLDEAMAASKETLAKAKAQYQEAIKDVDTEKLKEATKTATESIKDTASKLKEKFKFSL